MARVAPSSAVSSDMSRLDLHHWVGHWMSLEKTIPCFANASANWFISVMKSRKSLRVLVVLRPSQSRFRPFQPWCFAAATKLVMYFESAPDSFMLLLAASGSISVITGWKSMFCRLHSPSMSAPPGIGVVVWFTMPEHCPSEVSLWL